MLALMTFMQLLANPLLAMIFNVLIIVVALALVYYVLGWLKVEPNLRYIILIFLFLLILIYFVTGGKLLL